MFSQMTISKYVVWIAAALLLIGIIQILVGLFVFLSDALDIYMLVRRSSEYYCILGQWQLPQKRHQRKK